MIQGFLNAVQSLRNRSYKKIVIRFLFAAILVSVLPANTNIAWADDMTWSAGTGVSKLSWSGKATVTSQTGWRLEW
jgi:hypothetical protein